MILEYTYSPYSSGADESSLSSVGHHLSGKELLVLQDILQEDVIDSLHKIGLDLKTIGDTQTTIEEVQGMLHSLEQHEVASSLRQLLDSGKRCTGNKMTTTLNMHKTQNIYVRWELKTG